MTHAWSKQLAKLVTRLRPRPDVLGRRPRLEPLSRKFGFDRGQPIDRYYIESFLADHRCDITGRVLEIGDSAYTRRFGQSAVAHADILHAQSGRGGAIVGDLATGQGVPRGMYDCIILTQTLPFIYDMASAVRTCHAALKPGGVVLATAGGISQISRFDMDRWGDFWRLTSLSARRLFEPVFAAHRVQVRTYGNVLAATALLQGLASSELRPRELDHHDEDYQVLIAIRARREVL